MGNVYIIDVDKAFSTNKIRDSSIRKYLKTLQRDDGIVLFTTLENNIYGS